MRQDSPVLVEPEMVGQLDLGDVPSQWRKLDVVIDLARRAANTRPPDVIDPRMVDESRPGGHRLYGQVERYLGAAHDCHLALPRLLASHGATQTAMWTLIRAQFEAGFYALWMLEPELSAERVYRGIRVEWLDDQQGHAYFREIYSDPSTPIDASLKRAQLQRQEELSDQHARTYGAECAQLGHVTTKPAQVNIIDELGKLKSEDFPEQRLLLRHVWRSLAGLQHGDLGALLRISSMDMPAEVSGGSLRARLAPSDAAFQTIATTTSLLARNAFLRYMQCHQPSNAAGTADLRAIIEFKQMWAQL